MPLPSPIRIATASYFRGERMSLYILLRTFILCLVMDDATSAGLAFTSSQISSFQNATITKAPSSDSGCPRPTDSATSNLPYESYNVGVIGLDQSVRSYCSSSYNCWYQSSVMGQLNTTSSLLGAITATEYNVGAEMSVSLCTSKC